MNSGEEEGEEMEMTRTETEQVIHYMGRWKVGNGYGPWSATPFDRLRAGSGSPDPVGETISATIPG